MTPAPLPFDPKNPAKLTGRVFDNGVIRIVYGGSRRRFIGRDQVVSFGEPPMVSSDGLMMLVFHIALIAVLHHFGI